MAPLALLEALVSCGALGVSLEGRASVQPLFPEVLWLAVPSRNSPVDAGSGVQWSAEHSGEVKPLGHGGQDPT